MPAEPAAIPATTMYGVHTRPPKRTASEEDVVTVLESSDASPPPGKELRRSGRASVARRDVQPARKKKRTLGVSTVNNQPVGQDDDNIVEIKKPKREEQKENTAAAHSRKLSIEQSRRRWLLAHQDLFQPLLPANSTFFDNLAAEAKKDPGEIIPFHELEEQPKLIENGTMKDYQLHGLSFLTWMYKNGMNCILGDEMGLGKTLQTLSLLAYIRQHHKGSLDPHLVICPLSVLPSWLSECARWTPALKALRFQGTQPERARLKSTTNFSKVDVVFTTYESYVAEDSWFKSRRWTYCILDEGHRIKNAETAQSGKLQGIGSLYRLILTGTPVHNNLHELWSLLHWLYPNVFTSSSERLFRDAFDLSKGAYSLPFLASAQALLGAIMLRRTKATVEMSVPPREETTVFIPLTEAQRFWTYRLLTRMDTGDLADIFDDTDDGIGEGRKEVREHLRTTVAQSVTGQQNQWKRLMNLLMQLRKVCSHPYLLPDAEPTPFYLGEHIVASSSKLIAIDKLLADIVPKGDRVLIFSQWTGMLDLLEDFMALRSIPYGRLDGSTPRARRALDIKLFQQEKSPYQVFLISTKAGGLGINLTKASHVIMCDSDWNPQNDLQAIARAHRIGQTKTVQVYRLICRGSVEDQMLDRIRRKLFLSLKVMGSDNPTENGGPQLASREIMDILRKGSSALNSNENDGMTLERFLDAPIADVLSVSRNRGDVRDARMRQELQDGSAQDENTERALLEDAEAEQRELLGGVAQVHSRLFEGRVVQRGGESEKTSRSSTPGKAAMAKEIRDIANEWEELQKRTRGPNRIVTIDGMEFIVAPSLEPTVAPKAPKKTTKKDWEHEDWCIYCRDGGKLICCNSCPRVFHAQCDKVRKNEKPTLLPRCPQHKCHGCGLSTAEAGGMLFRCQTCPQAFCEDCLPDGELDAVGDTLPELQVLGFEGASSIYYIRCQDCHQLFKEDPSVWESWKEEMRIADEALRKMQEAE